jgi:hypothetical protein
MKIKICETGVLLWLLCMTPCIVKAGIGDGLAAGSESITGNKYLDRAVIGALSGLAAGALLIPVFSRKSGAEKAAERDLDGMTGLMYSCYLGGNSKVKKYLASGSDVNQQDVRGYTALIVAARAGFMEIVELLLENRADPRLLDREGISASAHARNLGYSDIEATIERYHQAWLQEYGPLKDGKNVFGQSDNSLSTH